MSGTLEGKVIAFACSVGGVAKGISHRPVSGHLLPWMMHWLLSIIFTLVAVNNASHPASQNLEMEIKHLPWRAGKMWPSHAVAGAFFHGMVAVWEEVMMLPLGSSTWRGVLATCTFWRHGCWTQSMERKLEVLPVSAMAKGGPTV